VSLSLAVVFIHGRLDALGIIGFDVVDQALIAKSSNNSRDFLGEAGRVDLLEPF